MVSTNKLAPAIFVALLVIVVVAVIFGSRGCRGGDGDSAGDVAAVDATPTPVPTPSLQERLSERLRGTTLNTSDEVVRELIAALSSRPELAAWLVNEDLVRRFVASVNNVADGKSPRQHLEFLRPSEPFRAADRGGRMVVDPASYRRYDSIVMVFTSLDIDGTAVLFTELEPLIDDAYAEIAPPGARFADRLDAAIDELLEVPVLSGDVELEPKVLTFAYADDRLEGLSPAQRQLLRMGPDNVQAVQSKLRDLRQALRQR